MEPESEKDDWKIDTAAQKRGIAPNFVHGMDASALVLAVNEAKQHGVDSFALIHDSFGTHAADSARLAESLREAFVRLYEDHDVLEAFREEVQGCLPDTVLPPTPQRGTLDLGLVRHSKYFFA